jgi:hypothetical protein
MRMVGFTAALSLLIAMGATATASGAANPDPGGQPAMWAHHALLIDLHDLPKRYTCDELWYKFRDVLVAIGARGDLKILPYRCEPGAGSIAYSPKIQLEFTMPSVLTGRPASLAPLRVRARSVHLEPGTPSHLEDSDCALLEQMRSTLLRSIGTEITDFRLNCQAPSAAKPRFEVTVRAYVPAGQPPA